MPETSSGTLAAVLMNQKSRDMRVPRLKRATRPWGFLGYFIIDK